MAPGLGALFPRAGSIRDSILYALLREWRGTLLAPLAAHATHNLVMSLILAP